MDLRGFTGCSSKLPKSNSEKRLSGTTEEDGKKKIPRSGGGGDAAAADSECGIREQDRFMPIANVIRIMRRILPPHAKISDDAKETIQECVSEYISFITGEANERCQQEQRKTITAEDVLWAMSKLGFDDYVDPLTLYLHRYRELDAADRGTSIRADPSLAGGAGRRNSNGAEFGAYAAFGPGPGAFHRMGNGAFFAAGAAAMGGYFVDASAAVGTSQPALAGVEQFANHK